MSPKFGFRQDRQTDRRNKFVLRLPCFKKLSSEYFNVTLQYINKLPVAGISRCSREPFPSLSRVGIFVSAMHLRSFWFRAFVIFYVAAVPTLSEEMISLCAPDPPTTSPIPSLIPTSEPTAVPTTMPSLIPSSEPTAVPTSMPSSIPTSEPTGVPTSMPSSIPTSEPTAVPTSMLVHLLALMKVSN